MSTRIAINGLGRIGRCVVRALAERDTELELVAINDVADASALAALLRYDSVYGRFPAQVSFDDGKLIAGRLSAPAFSEADPSAPAVVVHRASTWCWTAAAGSARATRPRRT